MRYVIFTLGSRGDVQPYVALAQQLIRDGNEACICTGGSFRTLIEDHGIEFQETSSDLMAIAQTEVGKAVLEHPLKNIGRAIALSRDVINPAYEKTLCQFYKAAENADMIIYHPKALGAVDIANACGIACVSMPPVPITYPIDEFPNMAVTRKNLGSFMNRLTYRVNEKAESSQIKLINEFRKNVLHEQRRKAGAFTYSNGTQEIPIVYPISKHLFPEVSSWDGHVELPGFFFLAENNEDMPENVKTFIEQGERPIAVTFSSMPLSKPNKFVAVLKEALQETGNRAILLTGNSGIQVMEDEQICVLKSISHHVLFQKVKAVVHHGGVGTMAEALRSGIPQLIIPFSVDQPFWAERIYQLGVGIKPFREKELTIDRMVCALKEMDDPKLIENAERFAVYIKQENGVKNAAEYLESLLK